MRGIKLIKTYEGLPGAIYALFVGSVVNNLGNFVTPFLALFLTDKLGMSKIEAGLVVTLASIGYVPGALLGGKLADKVGRKRVYLASRALGALTLLPCAWPGATPFVPWLLVVNSLFRGPAQPVQSAMVADLTEPSKRQAAFSLIYLGANLGFVAGPAIAGLLYRRHLPWLFIGDAVTTLLSLLLVYFFVGESLPGRASQREKGEDAPAGERPEEGSLLMALLKRPYLLVVAAVLLAYEMANSQFGFGLPLQVRELYGADGPGLYGLLASMAGLSVVVFTTPVAGVTARLSHTTNMALGGLLYAVGFGMIGLISSRSWFYVSTIIWTLGEIAVTTNAGAYIAGNSPASHRGRFNAFFGMVRYAGAAAVPVLSGWIVDAWGVRAIWLVCFLVLSSASIVMFMIGFSQRRARSGEAQASS